MKELDKAIVNDDIKQIVFLIKNGVDSTGAVLIHLKDALIPEHFTEEQLLGKGTILSMDALKLAIPTYLQKSQSEYRYETYIKRLYLGIQRLLNAWESGTVKNNALEQAFNQHATHFLKNQWIQQNLPMALETYANEKEDKYISFKYQQWQQHSLADKESRQLDNAVLDALMSHWYQADGANVITKKIQENQFLQTVELYQSSKEGDKHFTEMNDFLCKKVVTQIYDGTINAEEISDAVVREKDLELRGAIKADIMPEFKKGVRNLFAKWRARELDDSTLSDVSRYVEKQLQKYTLPSELKDALVKRAIQQLLSQYRSNHCSAELTAELSMQFEQTITGFYKNNAITAGEFQNELAKAIFSQLLRDWKNQELSPQVSDYLQVNLLTDVYGLLQQLSLFVSRAAMFTMINQLQADVNGLKSSLQSQEAVQSVSVENGPDLDQSSTIYGLLDAQGFYRSPRPASNIWAERAVASEDENTEEVIVSFSKGLTG